jgi:sulfur relay (sulfurtransferase) DsrC/TusE family protein
MTLGPPKEADLLRKVDTAIEEVVRADSEMKWSDDGNFTKRQKYTDLVVSHFTQDSAEMPVTRGWFRYGRTLPAAPSGTGDFGPKQSPSPRQNVLYETGIDEFVEFLESEASHPSLTAEWWNADILDFLEEYYTHHAPKKYRDVYVENVNLRRVFDESLDDIARIRFEQRLSSKDGNSDIDINVDYYEKVGRIAARLQMELATIEELEPALNPVRDFTNLVEDVFMQLAKVSASQVSSQHLHVISRMKDFYDDTVWMYPSALMSGATTEGPNERTLSKWAGKHSGRFEETYEEALAEQRNECRNTGLLPGASDYQSGDDDVESAIEGMLRVADRMDR